MHREPLTEACRGPAHPAGAAPGGLLAVAAVLALTVLPATPGLSQQEEPRPMTVDDALDMVSIGTVEISPDGAWVLYSLSELDWEENERDSTTYRIAADGTGKYQFLGEDGGSDFRFSPDGRYLTFKREVDDEQQLFWMRTAGGEAVQLTEHATSVGSYEWSDDSTRIYFSAEDERPEDEEEAIEEGDDAIFVDEGPNGQRRDYWSNLWVFDVESKEEKRLTDEEHLVGSWDVSPDGTHVAFSARDTNRRNDGYRNELFVLDVSTGEIDKLTDNAAPEGGIDWSPDGRLFLFTAADDEEWENRNTKLWIMDPFLGEHRMLSEGFEGSPSGAVWSPDGDGLYFNGQQGTNTNVFRIDATTGEVEQLTDVTGTLRAAAWSADRSRFAATFSDHDTPEELWLMEVGSDEPVKLEVPNDVSHLLLADLEIVQWDSVGDYRIEGLVHLPPDAGWDPEAGSRPAEPLPLLLNIHGGPAGSFRNSWSDRYHIWAGLGWASLSPNVRGSSGYTDHLRLGNTVDVGEGIGFGDYQDLMHGVDLLVESGLADPEHLALRGWSYGGILGGWTITQTDRFQAASIGAGVYDWTSEYGPGFNHDVKLWHIGGTPWENAEGWRNQSALTHADNVTTPTLLIHGERDTTDTEQQSMMFFTALKDIGKAPVRYIKFPREPHGFREPRHQRIRDVEEIRWILQHTLGVEWEPWERPEKEEGEGGGGGSSGG